MKILFRKFFLVGYSWVHLPIRRNGDHGNHFILSDTLGKMLTRFIFNLGQYQRPVTQASLRLFNVSALRLADGDHTRSKAEEKAAQDLKTRKEKRWLDTVASDSGKNAYFTKGNISIVWFVSEAIVKGEKQHAKKQGDVKKDVSKLQKDTINAVQEKEAKGHLHKQDVGRRDTREERIGSGPGKQKKHWLNLTQLWMTFHFCLLLHPINLSRRVSVSVFWLDRTIWYVTFFFLCFVAIL